MLKPLPFDSGRKVSHLEDNIQALTIKLTPEQIKKIESACLALLIILAAEMLILVPLVTTGAKEFDPGFPHTMIGTDLSLEGADKSFILAAAGTFDVVKGPKPL